MTGADETEQCGTAPPAGHGPVDRLVGRPAPGRLGARIWAATRQLLCPHTHGKLVAIEWDGAAVYECVACGRHVEKSL